MASSSILRTPRLILEPFDERYNTDRYVGWLNDKDVTRYSELRHAHQSLESCRSYYQSFADSPNYFWALTRTDARPEYIGTMTAYVDPVNSVADIGILLGESSARGRGYGVEAWSAVCDFIFDVVQIRKITAGTIEPNQAMVQLMKKTGMSPDGRRSRQYVWEGQEVDIVHAALFRTDRRHAETTAGSYGTTL